MGAINVTIASPVNYGPYQLPNTAQTVYIRVNDTLRTPNCEVLDYIDIYRMHVRTATTVVPLGSPVRAIDIGDLNNDRSNDIVALTDSGNLWVGLNIGGNTLSTLALKRSDANIANAVGMSIGLFVNKDNNRDVAVVTSTRTYFCQGDGFGWLGPLTNSIYNANGVTFKTMAAGDINGDGRWDLLVGDSSGNIVILFNFQMDITGWQKGSIKQLLPMPINDIGLGKLQNA